MIHFTVYHPSVLFSAVHQLTIQNVTFTIDVVNSCIGSLRWIYNIYLFDQLSIGIRKTHHQTTNRKINMNYKGWIVEQKENTVL